MGFKRTMALLGLLLLTTACAGSSRHQSSSVVHYLYPEGRHVEEPGGIPRLSLPLDVGVAFVPHTRGTNGNFTERDKTKLLMQVSEQFRQRDFVGTIEVIPSDYLTSGGGFTNLDQIRSMYGIDVMVLVSYDQTQFTDNGFASLTYWTLIGAYIVPGEKNDTHTMMDAAVYDIASRKLLLRAPGVSHIRGKATPVNLSEELREDSLDGFKDASVDMIANLDRELETFKQRVRERPDEYQVVHGTGYRGGGSLDPVFVLVLLLAAGAGFAARHRGAR